MKPHHPLIAAAALLLAAPLAHAAGANGGNSLTAAGYAETFDSLGSSGTALPTGWDKYYGNDGDKASWKNSIPGNGAVSVASMTRQTGSLSTVTTPSGANNNGFNAALNASTLGDRVIATSPTGGTGAALELSLVNDTGYSFTDLVLSYDTVRFTATSSSDSDKLYGYQLFYSLDGASWTNVAALNPTLASVPNSVGVTHVSDATVSLASAVAVGASLYLRWVDDNGSPSPDQILGLNNVSVAAVPLPVPEPASALLLALGLGLTACAARRRAR